MAMTTEGRRLEGLRGRAGLLIAANVLMFPLYFVAVLNVCYGWLRGFTVPVAVAGSLTLIGLASVLFLWRKAPLAGAVAQITLVALALIWSGDVGPTPTAAGLDFVHFADGRVLAGVLLVIIVPSVLLAIAATTLGRAARRNDRCVLHR